MSVKQLTVYISRMQYKMQKHNTIIQVCRAVVTPHTHTYKNRSPTEIICVLARSFNMVWSITYQRPSNRSYTGSIKYKPKPHWSPLTRPM